MRDSRDKIIDQLIDDKNRIYTRLKREERENQVFRSQVKYLKQRLEHAEKKIKELSNEIVDSRAKKDIKEYKEVQSLVLSKRDFDKVTNEISNPSDPNKKLVNAFKANKSVIEDE